MRPERYTHTYSSRSGGGDLSLRARLRFAALVLLALLLLVLTRLDHPVTATLRSGISDIVRPVMQVVVMPVEGVRNLIANKDALFRAYDENKVLSEENDTLRHWQAVAQALKIENESLRQLVSYHPVENVNYVTAHVIAQSPDAYAGMLMIDAGSDQGLTSLQPVIDAYGLVGRVMEVGEHTARVLLLSDPSSRVPVISGNSRQHAILTGTGEELLRLNFVGGDPETITLGEPINTTAEGGLIPEPIMVGTVFRRDASGLLVKPLRPLARAEYVRVMVTK